jgi:hypothetical protein
LRNDKKKSMFKNWTVRKKIIAISTTILVVVAGGLFWINVRASKKAAIEQYVAQSRGIVLTAESVRDEMARKWDLGLFDQHQLVEWAIAKNITGVDQAAKEAAQGASNTRRSSEMKNQLSEVLESLIGQFTV